MNLASPDFRFGMLAVGAILLLAAIVSVWIPGNTIRTQGRRLGRFAVGLAGGALMIWALLPYLAPPPRPPPLAAVAPPLPPEPVDLIASATTALQACTVPSAPAVPNGATASTTEMSTAQHAFQAFDASTNNYAKCVDSTVASVSKQYGSNSTPEELHALDTLGMRAHNTAIDQEQAAVDDFNKQVRVYKAKHGKR
jgi:hypothetical protein